MSGRAPDAVTGWDIGGVNTKVARVVKGDVLAVRGCPYELQHDPAALVPRLRELALEAGSRPGEPHAVTMTAELSQMFRTKREGVAFVLHAVETAFPRCRIWTYAVDGRFLAPEAARGEPLAVAAANWAAAARLVAAGHPEALLVDVGTTTTDVVPIVGGVVVAGGSSDPERLAAGELVYTGALRTPAEAMASHVTVNGLSTGVSAEGFALAGDVHVWRGDLAPADYSVPTPDGRPPTREFAGERLARVVCADREMLDDAGISAIADALWGAQVTRIADAMARVRARHPSIHVAVTTGLGAFLGAEAARVVGLRVVPLAASIGDAAARCAPAAAVALLLESALAGARDGAGTEAGGRTAIPPQSAWLPAGVRAPGDAPREAREPAAWGACGIDTVVKLGGGILAHPDHLESALQTIGAAARERSLLVVPGGGPFADAVRDVDRRASMRLSDACVHWMAVLAMEQYAHLVAERLPGGVLVTRPQEAAEALAAGRLPVLAPFRWLREADPLPHTWEVTSDSIAAWVAGQVGARRLVLVKPPGTPDETVVDAYFRRTLAAGVMPVIVRAGPPDGLRAALGGGGEAGASPHATRKSVLLPRVAGSP